MPHGMIKELYYGQGIEIRYRYENPTSLLKNTIISTRVFLRSHVRLAKLVLPACLFPQGKSSNFLHLLPFSPCLETCCEENERSGGGIYRRI